MKKKIVTYFFIILFTQLMDLILLTILIYGFGISSHDDMLRDHFNQILLVLYPQLTSVFLISWMIRKRKSSTGIRILSALINGERKTFVSIILFIFIQFFLLGMLQYYQITPDKKNTVLQAGLIYVLIVVSLLALIFMIRLLVRTREQAARMTQEVYVEEINDMFTSIRGQRHDFLNHVQVIHTMAQMGKTEQLKNYVEDLVKETRDVSDIVHHPSPALAAFAQSKTTVALGKGIAFSCELPADWSPQETTVKVIDVIKILGNLVDNAFDESGKLSADQRHVTASIRAGEDRRIELVVSNKGRLIAGIDKARIFDTGYSTKGEGHTGLGLAIVQKRVKHYNGELHLSSEQTGSGLATTTFRILLPYSAS
ncbi:sensor histidine kinase [Cohnella soli]|uniref:histidine kinase n=1 Tax=Cohnella soli TaxID=425005 RepID=A0ABW0HSK0_9BACL